MGGVVLMYGLPPQEAESTSEFLEVDELEGTPWIIFIYSPLFAG